MEFTLDQLVAVGLIALFAGALVGAAVATWMNWPTGLGGNKEGGEA